MSKKTNNKNKTSGFKYFALHPKMGVAKKKPQNYTANDFDLWAAKDKESRPIKVPPALSLKELGVSSVKDLTEILTNHAQLNAKTTTENLQKQVKKQEQKIQETNKHYAFGTKSMFEFITLNEETNELDYAHRDEFEEHVEMIDKIMEDVNKFLKTIEMRIQNKMAS